MKNKSNFLLLLLCSTVFTIGCKKILEVRPESNITDAIYFQNEGDFEPYVTGIYTYLRSFANNITYGTERSEELIAASNSRFGVAWTQLLSPSSGAINYNDWYKAIGHCNLLLEKIKPFSFASNPDLKKKIIAETYCQRAYFYFSLTRIIGDAPLMLQAVVDEHVPLLKRSPAKEVIQQIYSDIDSAILMYSSMPSFSPSFYSNKYRFSYGAAQALKADVAMWSAKVVEGGAGEYEKAINAIREVEASGVSLNADFKNVVAIRAPANPEIILSAYFSRDETGGNYAVNALPFLSIVQGALNLDSLPYTISSANGQGAYQISPLSKSLFSDNPQDKRIPYTWITERQPDGPKISWITKYPGTKYADERIADNDVIIYRLADLYLLKAEAFAALNNTDSAITYLNRVKQRAAIPNYTGTKDKRIIEKNILDERGRELYFENKRWYDLVRFHKGGTINVYDMVPNLKGKNTPLYWPLNSTVLANNDLLEQTEGYQ